MPYSSSEHLSREFFPQVLFRALIVILLGALNVNTRASVLHATAINFHEK